MKIDAMFFLQNADGEKIAIHVEIKRDNEPLSIGQAEAYRPRAICYRDQRRHRKGILTHDHVAAVLFCGKGTDLPHVSNFFDRVIQHDDAFRIFPGYPNGSFST